MLPKKDILSFSGVKSDSECFNLDRDTQTWATLLYSRFRRLLCLLFAVTED
jgi:hypothetical protein